MAISVLRDIVWLESVPTAMQRATDRTISMCRLWDLMADSFMRCDGMIARLMKAFMTNRVEPTRYAFLCGALGIA